MAMRPPLHVVLSFGAVALALALLVGCETASAPDAPGLLATTKVNQVDFVERRFDVAFTDTEPGLTDAERRHLAEFLVAAGRRFGDPVEIPAATPDMPELVRERLAAVSATLSEFGFRPVPKADLALSTLDAIPVRTGYWRVTSPPCPDWTKAPGLDFANTGTSNFGCANVTNLGLMVADPGDLVRGRDAGYADGTAAARAVEAYRKGEVKELPEEDKSGISAVVTFE